MRIDKLLEEPDRSVELARLNCRLTVIAAQFQIVRMSRYLLLQRVERWSSVRKQHQAHHAAVQNRAEKHTRECPVSIICFLLHGIHARLLRHLAGDEYDY